MRFINLIVVFAILCLFQQPTRGQNVNENPESIEDLEQSISIILKNKQTPSVGIAIVDSTGPIWVTSIGKADVEKEVDANENTMYRIGSVSKMFVALAVLKLQEEGKLSLKDKLRDRAPDLEYTNHWADTHPILVEHLLEHTTGWDDFHLTEYAHRDSIPIKLGDGLAYHPHSRTTRWIPGTRMAYCNSGPPAAAYIVENVTGQRFEDYVQHNFFDPLGMETATYFLNENYRNYGATLYMQNKPQSYWHILQRPSGSINASPKDFVKMVEFFLNRGRVDSLQIISESSLNRMETPMTSVGAKAGLQTGYGLANYSTDFEGFVFRSHSGGVGGGLTDFSYLPEYKIGYMISINSHRGDALNRIGGLIKKFLTRNIAIDSIEHQPNVVDNPTISGYYTTINPRNQQFFFLDWLFDVTRVRLKGGKVYFTSLFGKPRGEYTQVTKNTFSSAKNDVINLVQVEDPLVGTVLHRGGWQVLKPIPAIFAIGKILLVYIWVGLMGISIIFGIVMLIRSQIRKYSNTTIYQLWLWPFLASVTFCLSWLLITFGSNHLLALGTVSFLSVSIMIATLCFGLASLVSIWVAIRKWKVESNKVIHWASMILIAINFLAAVYFLMNGGIGFRTWT